MDAKVARVQSTLELFEVPRAISSGKISSSGKFGFREEEEVRSAQARALSLKNIGYEVVTDISPAFDERGGENGFYLTWTISW